MVKITFISEPNRQRGNQSMVQRNSQVLRLAPSTLKNYSWWIFSLISALLTVMLRFHLRKAINQTKIMQLTIKKSKTKQTQNVFPWNYNSIYKMQSLNIFPTLICFMFYTLMWQKWKVLIIVTVFHLRKLKSNPKNINPILLHSKTANNYCIIQSVWFCSTTLHFSLLRCLEIYDWTLWIKIKSIFIFESPLL